MSVRPQGQRLITIDDSLRQRLIDLLRRIVESSDIQHYDEAGEVVYAGLVQLGVVEGAESSPILYANGELAALVRLVDTLDQMFSVIGNCPTEEQNLKRLAWEQVAAEAHTAYQILTTHNQMLRQNR